MEAWLILALSVYGAVTSLCAILLLDKNEVLNKEKDHWRRLANAWRDIAWDQCDSCNLRREEDEEDYK